MAKPASRFQREQAQRVVNMTPPVKESLTAIKEELEEDKKRQVTYSEVVEELVRHYRATAALVRDAREAGR